MSWFATRALLLGEVDERVDRELTGEVAELALLAEAGVDPVTGEPFEDARSLLRLFLERSIPDENETMFALIGGVVDARSSDIPPLRIDDDPSILTAIADASETVLMTFSTDAGRIRLITAPVVAGENDDADGRLVVAIFADAEAAAVGETMRGLLWLWAVTLAVATAIGWVVAGHVLAPLRHVTETAREISESDLSRRIPVDEAPTGDEIDELARTFNDMLDRLATSFAAQRTFIDDAGHELRTPLTIARGHLELMQTGDETSRAVVLDELDRMGRIVNDMQTLTKATTPGFLRLERLDIGEVVDEVLVKAAALADRTWSLDATTQDDDVLRSVVADRQRLIQAMLQLARNAVAHTGPGEEIGIGARTEDGSIVLHVRDVGPGVPAADRERIFNRFVRGAWSGGDGSGLGLAIVAAIVGAHGGRARVVSAPGGGAQFELVLPGSTTPTDRERS